MVGFPQFFHVNDGHPVLKHPLYLKYNTSTARELEETPAGSRWQEVKQDLDTIMMTNDNMAIIWYLTNLLRIGRDTGNIEPK